MLSSKKSSSILTGPWEGSSQERRTADRYMSPRNPGKGGVLEWAKGRKLPAIRRVFSRKQSEARLSVEGE